MDAEALQRIAALERRLDAREGGGHSTHGLREQLAGLGKRIAGLEEREAFRAAAEIKRRHDDARGTVAATVNQIDTALQVDVAALRERVDALTARAVERERVEQMWQRFYEAEAAAASNLGEALKRHGLGKF